MGNTYCIQAKNGLEHKGRVHRRVDRRVRAYEEQFQPFIWKLRRHGRLLGFLPEKPKSGFARFRYSPMTHKVDEGAACCGQQPGLRILWHAVSRPSRQCCYQCVAEGVLRAGYVARM